MYSHVYACIIYIYRCVRVCVMHKYLFNYTRNYYLAKAYENAKYLTRFI